MRVGFELETSRAEQDAEIARNRAAYVTARDAYLGAQEVALESTREYVAAVERAALLRREMEQASRRPGSRVSGEIIPEPISVLAGRDRKLRELRADARDASSLARW
jgi:hypothetical protein